MYCKTKNTNLIITALLMVLLFSIYGISETKAGPPWDQVRKLIVPDESVGAQFGNSVAISGNIAVIGAYFENNDNGRYAGSAYVFDIPTGQQLFNLLASDGSDEDYFGFSVAVSGNIAVVGAYQDDDNGTSSGSVYVFDVTTGQQLFKLLPEDGSPYKYFGISVAISGNHALIGAKEDNDNGNSSEIGRAHV